MRPTDLSRYVTPSRPALSPDGSRVLFTVSRMNLDDDLYDTSVWLWDRANGARRFTAGPGDSTPVWSPDGRKAAFLRKVDDVPQLAVIDLEGGEARVVSHAPKGLRGMEWLPDGSGLVAHWVEWEAEWADLDADARSKMPRRISTLPYRFDTLGWVHTDRHRLAVIPLDGETRFLTDPLPIISSPRLAPDAGSVVFLSDLNDVHLHDMRRAVYRVSIEGGDPEEIAPLGDWAALTVNSDGTVHATGFPEPMTWPASQTLWRLGTDGWTEVSPGLDRSLVLVFGTPIVPQPTTTGVVSALEDAGKVGLIAIADDGTITRLVDEDMSVTGFSPSPDGSVVAFTASGMDRPGELHLWTDDGVERITDLNGEASAALGLVAGEHFTVAGPGGPIDAWIYLPPGDDTVPLLLNIHGGPASQYGFGFFDEFQVYAGAGFGVVACNPRGSSGRGTEWMKDVVGDGWGTNDLADIRAVVDAALARETRLDGDRLGVMGGSYGGFLTGWIIGNERRWRSAVVERALLSFPSFAGTSDIGHTFPEFYIGVELPDGEARLWEKSPQSLAHTVTTPTLLVHSENDFRCPIEQAEQFFMQLLRNGTPVEMLRFPGESHELSRSGKPKHRQQRFEAILDWHERHLG